MVSTNFPNVAAALAVAGLFAAVPSPTAAQAIRSDYTSTAEKACKTFAKNKPSDEMPWSEMSCPGRAGLVVRLFDADLRMTVSVGRSLAAAEQEPAATQGFGAFNNAHDTVEWRSVRGKPPFAIIQRWTVGGENDKRQLLVVTRLPPGPVCHIAHIDARAGDANAVAREVAEQKARDFRCGVDEIGLNRPRATHAALVMVPPARLSTITGASNHAIAGAAP